MANKMQKILKSTQMLLPIREISNGLIVTKDNRYIKILEVLPVNFLMKSSTEQNAIARAFRDVFKIGPASMQFKAISRRANMARHMQILKQEIMVEKSQRCTEMQLAYMQMLKLEAASDSVSRRFFISFEYEHEAGLLHRATKAEIKGQMDAIAYRITGALAECGNEVVTFDDQDQQLEEILYTLLDPAGARKQAFESRRKEVRDRYMAQAELPQQSWNRYRMYIPVTDLVAPERIDFPASDYMVVSGRYYTYAYIPCGGYNPSVITGWMASFINASEGIDVDIFFNRIPREQVIFRIRQTLNQNRASLMGISDTKSAYDSLTEAVRAGQYLKDGLASGEDFYYMAVLVTISGSSRKNIEWKFNELKKMLAGRDIEIRKCKWEMYEAYFSSMPLCRMDRNLWKKAKRNVLTSGAATTYPFTSFELMDEDGVLLGRNTMNDSLAIVDIYNTSVYMNANMFIAGTSGAGKTFSMLLIAMRLRIKHIPVIIIAPEKEHEFERVAQAMDGQFIRFGSGSPHCINIMEIFKTDDTVRIVLDGGSVISSKLSEKVQDLKTFFKLLIPDITYEERELLDEALMLTYYKKGITEDNDSLFDPENPEQYREMPVLGDLYEELVKIEKLQRVANIIKVLVSGSGKNFNSQTNVNLDNEFVVLGLEHLSDDLLSVGMFMAIDYAWSKIKEDRTRKKALMIDEWWRFAFDPLAADYSLKIAKTIRAYGGSLILATQQMTDIFAIEQGKYGEGVLNNCKIKIIMKLEEQDAENVQKIMRLTSGETSRITRFKQGEALLVANSNSVSIKFESNRTEYNLITTDRKSLEEQVLEKMDEDERARFIARRKKELGKIINYLDLETESEDTTLYDEEEGELIDIDEALSNYFEKAEAMQEWGELDDIDGMEDYRTKYEPVDITGDGEISSEGGDESDG